MASVQRTHWWNATNLNHTATADELVTCRSDIGAASAADLTTLAGKVTRLEGARGANVLALGVAGDGVTDDYPLLQLLLNMGDIWLPWTEHGYLLSKALKSPGNRYIGASRQVLIKRKDHSWLPGEAGLLECAVTTGSGSPGITVEGGVWDGNCANNTRVDTVNAHQALFRLKRAHGLTLKDLTLKDPLAFSTLITLSDGILISGIVFDQPNETANQDGIHCIACNWGRVENLRGNCTDDVFCIATYDSEFYRDGADGVGPSIGMTVDGVYCTNTSSFGRVLSAFGYLVDQVTIKNVRGWAYRIGIWAADAVGLEGPNYGTITLEGICIGRNNSRDTTIHPVVSMSYIPRRLIISDISRPEGDVTTVSTVAVGQSAGYTGTSGRVEVTKIYETSSVDRHSVQVYSDLASMRMDGADIVHTSGGKSASLIFVRDDNNIHIGELCVSGAHTDGVAAHVNMSGNQVVDNVQMSDSTIKNGHASVYGVNNSKFSLGISDTRAGVGMVQSLIYVDNSQMEFAYANGCRTVPGGTLLKVVGTGTGAHRFEGAANSGGIGWEDATNNLSVNCSDFSLDETKLVPLVGDQVKSSATGLRKQYNGFGWVP